MRRASPLLLLAALAACSPAYVYQAWRGQERLMSSRRPIARVLADPSTPPKLREELRLVEDIRRFAFERMAIPPCRNYTTYAPVSGEAVTWVVSASRKTAFLPKTWWFPFVGSVPYEGFFDKPAASRAAARLRRDGWDVFVGGSAAYSTLRWFQDPVVSTMLSESPGELAEILLHELTHTAVFFKGRIDFDEALATFAGQTGARQFLAERFGPASKELAEYRRELAGDASRSAAIEKAYGELERLYAGPLPDAEKLRRREEVFARHQDAARSGPLDNAVILAQRRYHYDLSDFEALYERQGRDWSKTLRVLKSLDPRDPRADLRRRIRT